MMDVRRADRNFTKRDGEKLRRELLVELEGTEHRLQHEMRDMRKDVSSFKKDVSVVKADVSVLKADVSSLKTDVSGLKADVSKMSDKQDKLYDLVVMDVARLKEAVFGR